MENEVVLNVIKPVRSVEIGELAQALALAQSLMEPATKDAENPFFHSSYADLASVWRACREPLTKNGLSVTQLVKAKDSIVTVETLLLHSSGQFISSELSMKCEKETPQGIGSAITYARRYALSAIVGISSEDDDGNEVSGKKGKPEVKTPQEKKSSAKTELEEASKKVEPRVKTEEEMADLACSLCFNDITQAEKHYSLKKYGERLCRECQKNSSPLANEGEL